MLKKEKTQKLKLYGLYTLLYLAMLWICFRYFPANNRTLINGADAWRQHLKALMYFSKWMRGSLYHLFREHSLSLQNWSFGLGYGADAYPTLQYYAFGDLLNVPSVFVPTEYLPRYFEVVTLVRPYIAGLTFSGFALYVRPRTKTVTMLTAMLTYGFGSYFLYLGIWHPYFANPLIYFPLVLWGAERLLRKKGPALFALSVFLAAANNFYFFYMIALLTVVYVAIRLLFLYGKDFRAIGKDALSFLLSGVTGVLMAMFVLLPVLCLFRENPRTTSGRSIPIIYSGDYYTELLENLISFTDHGKYDTQLGFHAAVVLCLFALIAGAVVKRRRERVQILLLILILTVLLLLPAGGLLMTAFAYVSNRFSFVFALAAAFLIVDCGPELCTLSKPELAATAGLTLLYGLALFFRKGAENENVRFALLSLGLLLVLALAVNLLPGLREKKHTGAVFSILLFLSALCGIAENAHYAYAPEHRNIIADFTEAQTPEETMLSIYSTEVWAAEQAAEQGGYAKNDFYRYTGRNLVWNAALLDGVTSTQFYWSLANGVVSDYFMEMANNDQQNFAYFAMDDRAILNTLASVRYYTLRYNTEEEQRYVPYGFHHVYDYYNFAVYDNSNSLPFGYTYRELIPKETYNALSPAGRQEALLYGAVTEDIDAANRFSASDFTSSSETIPFEITASEGASLTEGYLEAGEPDTTLTLSFAGRDNCETYLYFRNLHTAGTSEDPILIIGAYEAGQEVPATVKEIDYKTQDNQFYSGWHDYIVNTGYAEQGKTCFKIRFPEPGVYTWEELSVICQPLSMLSERAGELRRDSLFEVDLHKNPISFATNRITAKIISQEPEILCLTMPYSKGWTAYVDGVKTPLYKVNTMFTGLTLSGAGMHEIEMRYRTPGLLPGALLSLAGWAGFVCAVVLMRKKERKNEAKKGNS